MKKSMKKAEKVKDELKKEELEEVVGGLSGLRSLSAKSFDPQPEPPGKISILNKPLMP